MSFSVLTAGFDARFLEELQEALVLLGAGQVRHAQTAQEAVAYLAKSPDLLITELILQGGDGLSLLEQKPQHTKAVACSSIADPFFYAKAAALGAADCIARPVPPLRLARRAVQLLHRDAPQKNRIYGGRSVEQNCFLYDARIQKILLSLSLPVTLDGFSYLRFCTLACLKDPSLLRKLTGSLYPLAGKEFSVSPACIERSMRYGVEHIFECARMDALERFFGCCADPAKGKLSVGAFLAQMVQLAQCEMSD